MEEECKQELGAKKKKISKNGNISMEKFIEEMSDKNVSKDYVRIICRAHETISVYARLLTS